MGKVKAGSGMEAIRQEKTSRCVLKGWCDYLLIVYDYGMMIMKFCLLLEAVLLLLVVA